MNHLFALSLNVKPFFLPIDRTLSGATTRGQSKPGDDGDGEVLYILQRSSLIGASPLDYLMSYHELYLWNSYPSAEIQSVYSTNPADWVCHLTLTCYVSRILKCVTSLLSWPGDIPDNLVFLIPVESTVKHVNELRFIIRPIYLRWLVRNE